VLKKSVLLQADVVAFPTARVLVGAGLWVLAWVVGRFPLEVAILLFAPLVIVPLARRLIPERDDARGAESLLARLIAWSELPAAGSVVASFFVAEPGVLAGILALPWFGVTLLTTAQGVLRGLTHRRQWFDEFGYCGGLMLLAVGGFWIVASRMGWRPGGFSEQIVLLSGVRFHYAAFALPILASRIGATVPKRLARTVVISVTAGVPLVGLGISSLPQIEIAAVVFLVASCLALAGLLVRFGMRHDPRVLLLSLVAATSLASGMVLAGVFGFAELFETTWINIPAMIATHGLANAFGFTLCGLLAVYRAQVSTEKR
jgi:hypothetical protein